MNKLDTVIVNGNTFVSLKSVIDLLIEASGIQKPALRRPGRPKKVVEAVPA